jgi:hypothetical protein
MLLQPNILFLLFDLQWHVMSSLTFRSTSPVARLALYGVEKETQLLTRRPLIKAIIG